MDSPRILAATCLARSCAAAAEIAFSEPGSKSKSSPKSPTVPTLLDELARRTEGLGLVSPRASPASGDGVPVALWGLGDCCGLFVAPALLLNRTRPFSFLKAATVAASAGGSGGVKAWPEPEGSLPAPRPGSGPGSSCVGLGVPSIVPNECVCNGDGEGGGRVYKRWDGGDFCVCSGGRARWMTTLYNERGPKLSLFSPQTRVPAPRNELVNALSSSSSSSSLLGAAGPTRLVNRGVRVTSKWALAVPDALAFRRMGDATPHILGLICYVTAAVSPFPWAREPSQEGYSRCKTHISCPRSRALRCRESGDGRHLDVPGSGLACAHRKVPCRICSSRVPSGDWSRLVHWWVRPPRRRTCPSIVCRLSRIPWPQWGPGTVSVRPWTRWPVIISAVSMADE